MREYTNEEIQKVWDKYPVNWWLKLYDKTLIKKPTDKTILGLKYFTFVCVSTCIAGFIGLFAYSIKFGNSIVLWVGGYQWLAVIAFLMLSLPLITMFIISFPGRLMQNWRLRKIAKELKVSRAELDKIMSGADIKIY
jgi:ABC-type multidrug transport system fused ATPase/permease subunit